MQGIPPRDLPDGDTLTAVDGRLVPASTIAGAVSGSIAVNTLASATGVGKNIKGSQLADGVTGSVLTVAGTLTAPRTLTLPDAAVTIPAGTLLTGTLANANRLDSTSSAGVVKESLIADGVTGSVLTIAGTLTALRTLTLPDASVTIPAGTLLAGTLANANRLDSTSGAGVVKESQIADAVTGNVLTIAGTLTAPRTVTLPDAAVTIPAGTLITGTIANANRLDSTSAAGVIKESLIADGISTSVLTIAGTLTAPRTLTLPDASVTIPVGTLLTGTLANANRLDSTSGAGVVKESLIADGISTSVLTIAGTLTAPRTHTHQDIAGTIPLIEVQPVASFQNKLINPRFDIWQRGTTFTPALNTETYDADRFFTKIDGTSVVFTVSQQAQVLGTLADEPAYFRRCAITTAGTVSTITKILSQRIEGVRIFAGKKVMLAFKAKADAARTITPNFVQAFGTGGAPSASVTGAGTGIAITTSWAAYTQVITLPSISGKTMGTTLGTDYLEVWLSAAANTVQTIDISDIEFKEVAASGQVNTPFEIRPLAVELALCQRYYQSFLTFVSNVGELSFYAGSTTVLLGTFPLKVTMRATPTFAFQSQGTGGGSNTVRNANTNVAVTPTSPTTFVTPNAIMGVNSTIGVYGASVMHDFGATLTAEL